MSAPHERLSEAMRRRSLELRKRWVDIAKDADITVSALGGIRRGDYKPSAHTARALEDALQWQPGTIQAILQGDPPTPATTLPETDESAEVLADRIRNDPELARAMARLIARNMPGQPEPSEPPARDAGDGDLSEAG